MKINFQHLFRSVAGILLICTIACTSTNNIQIPNDEKVELDNTGLVASASEPAHTHDVPHVTSLENPSNPPLQIPHRVNAPAFGSEGTPPLGLAALTTATQIKVRLKILILTTSLNDDGYKAAKQLMNRVGMQFDTFISTTQTITPAMLETQAGFGNYNGIILATDLVAQNPSGVWESSLSITEWQLLANYETNYRVRRLTLFAYPDATTTGLEIWEDANTSTLGYDLKATLTPAGQTIFNDLQAAAVIPIKWTYAYLATTVSTATTPLLKTLNGDTIAAVYKVGTRENLVMTMQNTTSTPHTSFLGYGLLRWLTKGVFIGERKMYFNIHVDDLFISSAQWDPATHGDATQNYRMTGADLLQYSNWQNNLRQRYPLLTAFTTDLLLNGSGFNRTVTANCTTNNPTNVDNLSAMAKCPSIKNNFRFVNHTFSHISILRTTPRAILNDEIQKNIDVATNANALGLIKGIGRGQFDASALVTGGHSGLGNYWWTPIGNLGRSGANPNLISAAQALGIKSLGSAWSSSSVCHSTPADCDVSNPSFNTGNRFPVTSLVAGIPNLPTNDLLIQPRFPPALTPNMSTPTQVRSYTNFSYNNTLSYSQIIDLDTDSALTDTGNFWVNARYFHQANLRSFKRNENNVTTSLLADWIEQYAKKYTIMYRIPIVNLSATGINQVMRDRSIFDITKPTGIWNKTTGITTVTSNNPNLNVPVTNAFTGTAYGVDRVMLLKNGQTTNTGIN